MGIAGLPSADQAGLLGRQTGDVPCREGERLAREWPSRLSLVIWRGNALATGPGCRSGRGNSCVAGAGLFRAGLLGPLGSLISREL